MGDYGSDAKGASARLLSQAWEHLRLAERAPLRFPSWDAILVTAASNAQAALYQQQLEAARYFGRIAEGTLVLAVPDPQGKRIGSGGATLSALRVLADQLSSQIDNPAPSHRKSVGQSQSSGGATPTGTETVGETGGVPVSGIVDPRIEGALEVLAGFRVLLVHGGGDSKRVPWANPIGKPFIPLPFLVARDSDEPVPTLFDHILAVAAPALGAMQGGGVLIMTGDVLPIFDSKFLFTPDDGACIVTTLASLDVASRHGVLVSEGGSRSPQNQGGGNDEKRAPTSANQSDLKRNRSSDSILDPQAPVSVKPLNLMSLPPIASIAKPTPIAAHPLFSSPPPSPHAAERSSSPKILSPRTVSPPPGSDPFTSPRTYRLSSRSPPPLPTVPEAPVVTQLEQIADRATQPESPRAARSPANTSKPPLYPPPRMVQPLSVSSLLSLQQAKPYYSAESSSAGGELSPPLQPLKNPLERAPASHAPPAVEPRGLVTNLLQKPNALELEEAGALVGGGAALLDTGIFAVKGGAWRDLLTLMALRPNPVEALLTSGEEMSLYEEMAGAWVPARHSWLQSRPLGPLLTEYLGRSRLWYHFAPELEFLHFGTTSEVLDHLASGWPMADRQLSNVRGDVGLNTVVIGSTVDVMASIGDGGLICDSKLGAQTTVGSRCVIFGLDTYHAHLSKTSSTLAIPSHLCVWVVPLLGGSQVTVCCGVDDNPKEGYREPGSSKATFCGVPLGDWLQARGVSSAELWPGFGSVGVLETGSGSPANNGAQDTHSQSAVAGSDRQPANKSTQIDSKPAPPDQTPVIKERNLWNASLYPVEERGAVLDWVPWFIGRAMTSETRQQWRGAQRLSLAQIHRRIDFAALDRTVRIGRGELALGILQRDVQGLLQRNVAALSEQILWGFNTQSADSPESSVNAPSGRPFANVLASDWAPGLAERLEANIREPIYTVPRSRLHMARADLLRAGGHVAEADQAEEDAWRAVASETATGVGIAAESTPPDDLPHHSEAGQRPGIREQGLALQEATLSLLTQSPAGVNGHLGPVGEVYRVELPVRLDIAGGWSDTPPWSLERVGRVLNIAADLEGRPPVGVEVEVTGGGGVSIQDDEGRECKVEDLTLLDAPLAIDDPFAVAKAALVVTGFGSRDLLGPERGLRISTWADVPRGSGLGTSSILAAALVRGLLRAQGASDSNEDVSHKVLVLEQLMGTGGGWQDQVGALWPGAKCTTSLPSRPLRLVVEEVPLLPALRHELESRLVLVFTGKVRLARNVLQKVVGRYLRRDARAIASVRRLTELATAGQKALATGDLTALGAVMSETWGLHQELDPHCSNPDVERLFSLVDHLSVGHKLLGAGGGGFALILAKDVHAAAEMRAMLDEFGPPAKVHSWSLG